MTRNRRGELDDVLRLGGMRDDTGCYREDTWRFSVDWRRGSCFRICCEGVFAEEG